MSNFHRDLALIHTQTLNAALAECGHAPRPNKGEAVQALIDLINQGVTTLDKMVKTAPAGSDVAVAALKSAISGINAAYENMTKSAKQFVDLTHANVEAATTQAISAGKKKAA